MKKRTLIVFLILAVITAFCFTACGSKETMTLEKYVQDNPDVQESIDSAMNDSNVAVEIKENDICYNFDLSKMDGYTEELAKSDEIKNAVDYVVKYSRQSREKHKPSSIIKMNANGQFTIIRE